MCQFPRKITTHVPSPKNAYLMLPTTIEVPCGKCLECKKRRASEWRYRLKQESKDWSFVSFITLTYDSDNLPVYNHEDDRVYIGRKNKGVSTLYVKDLQNFFKNLRYHKHGIIRFKYFAIGEYGYNGTVRPHYHIVLFHNTRSTKKLCAVVSKVWNKGIITCTRANANRLAYVADYCSNGAVSAYERYKPPFMVCSLRSPIGYSWLNSDLARLCFERGERVVTDSFFTKSGQRISYKMCIPRFYLRKMGMIYNRDELLDIMAKEALFKRFGVKKPKTIICGTLKVDCDYERMCHQAYNKLVNSHKYREYEQHIKFPFSTWVTSFHQFELNALKKRLSVSPIQMHLLQISAG